MLAALPACFDPDQPPCAFTCGIASKCPENYTCNKTDNYCHRNDFKGACPFPPPDAATPPDQSATPPDLAPPDLAPPDLAGSARPADGATDGARGG
ncbi:MAG: hypothetical protein EXR72_14525 [Myxococcales bacterium]|nr:hypothetical protein [Myxococcales bacterium]